MKVYSVLPGDGVAVLEAGNVAPLQHVLVSLPNRKVDFTARWAGQVMQASTNGCSKCAVTYITSVRDEEGAAEALAQVLRVHGTGK